MRSAVPKMLHRVCGKQMVALVVEAAEAADLGPTYVVVPAESAEIPDVLGPGVSYVDQSKQLGSGHALLQARSRLNGAANVAVMNGDTPLLRPDTLAEMMRLHLADDACITMLTAVVDDPEDLGRVVRNGVGDVAAVVEYADADSRTRGISEVNAGVYCFRASWLWENLFSLPVAANGEVYLTDLVSVAAEQGMKIVSINPKETEEAIGINTRVDLARADAAMRRRIRERWMLAGVTMLDPGTVYIGCDVELGKDTVLRPNTHLSGSTRIGERCEIGPNSTVNDCDIGDDCTVVSSVLEKSTLEKGVHVGPFSHVRRGCRLEAGVHVGSHVELKESRLGRGTRAHHFSYIGDAEVGADVNIGAGTVTCNYDGEAKHRTVIEDGAFIGSDTMLVAPVTIGAGAATGAGAVVTKDVAPGALAKGVPARAGVRKRPDE